MEGRTLVDRTLQWLLVLCAVAMVGYAGLTQYDLATRLVIVESELQKLRARNTSIEAAQLHVPGTVSIGDLPTIGEPGASFALIEFGDFQCRFCAMFVRDVWPTLRREYVETGKVLVAFHNYPLTSSHPFARKAAEAAICARQQGRFWELHDRLYELPDMADGGEIGRALAGVPLEAAKFEHCLSNDGPATLEKEMLVAAEFGVTATPTFIIGRLGRGGVVQVRSTVVGFRPLEQFRAALDSVLQGSN